MHECTRQDKFDGIDEKLSRIEAKQDVIIDKQDMLFETKWKISGSGVAFSIIFSILSLAIAAYALFIK